jgi:hypothetical protein
MLNNTDKFQWWVSSKKYNFAWLYPSYISWGKYLQQEDGKATHYISNQVAAPSRETCNKLLVLFWSTCILV